jgi:hypothetical protein
MLFSTDNILYQGKGYKQIDALSGKWKYKSDHIPEGGKVAPRLTGQ